MQKISLLFKMKNFVFIGCLCIISINADINQLEKEKTAKQTSILLGYKPIRPFYKPGPVNYPTEIIRPQIRPTETFISPSSTYETTHTTTLYKPSVTVSEPSTFLLPPRFNQTSESTIQTSSNNYYPSSTINPSSVSLASSTNIYEPTIKPPYLYEEGISSTITTERLPPSYVLGYKPMRPPYKPSPVNYPTEIIRPQTRTTITEHSTDIIDHSSQINQQQSSIKPPFDNTINPSSISSSSVASSSLSPPTTLNEEHPTKRPPSIVLEYQPIRPFYKPGPVNYPTEIIRPQIRPTTVTTQIHQSTINSENFLQPDVYPSSTSDIIQASTTSQLPTESSINVTNQSESTVNLLATDELIIPTVTTTEKLPSDVIIDYKPTDLMYKPDSLFHSSETIKPIQVNNTYLLSLMDTNLNTDTSTFFNSSTSNQSSLIDDSMPIKSPDKFEDLSTSTTEHILLISDLDHLSTNATYKPTKEIKQPPKPTPNQISSELFDDIFTENVWNRKNSNNVPKDSPILLDIFDYAPSSTHSIIPTKQSVINLISSTELQVTTIKPTTVINREITKIDIF